MHTYSPEHGFETPADKHNRRVDSKEWIPLIPKLYVISIEGTDPFICDRMSIDSMLEEQHGGHCITRFDNLNGSIEFLWRDSIDNEFKVYACPSPVYLFGREIQEAS